MTGASHYLPLADALTGGLLWLDMQAGSVGSTSSSPPTRTSPPTSASRCPSVSEEFRQPTAGHSKTLFQEFGALKQLGRQSRGIEHGGEGLSFDDSAPSQDSYRWFSRDWSGSIWECNWHRWKSIDYYWQSGDSGAMDIRATEHQATCIGQFWPHRVDKHILHVAASGQRFGSNTSPLAAQAFALDARF